MASGLLDEGAGPYDSQAFRAELEDNAIRLSFEADRDGITGELRTLTATRAACVRAAAARADAQPRFDAEPVERIRSQILTELRRREADPDYLASRAWFAAAFPDHPYGRPTRGTPELGGDAHRRRLPRLRRRPPRPRPAGGRRRRRHHRGRARRRCWTRPSATCRRAARCPRCRRVAPRVGAHRGAAPGDPAERGHVRPCRARPPRPRLLRRLRRQLHPGRRRLQLAPARGGAREARPRLLGLFLSLRARRRRRCGWAASPPTTSRSAQSIALVRQELARMAQGELDATDLANARTYLTGSFPLRLTSNDQIAKTLARHAAARSRPRLPRAPQRAWSRR